MLPDIYGKLRRLSTQRDKDVLLVFGNTSCPHCSDKISLLNKIDNESAGDFEVIFVALGATVDVAKNYVKDRGIKFNVLADTFGLTGKAYGVNYVPEAFIIDRDGVIQYSGSEDGPAIWQILGG